MPLTTPPPRRTVPSLLVLVASILCLLAVRAPALAHDAPLPETFVPGTRYKPFSPEDPAYAIHYRPYMPPRAAVRHVHAPRKVVRARPVHRHRWVKHHHPRHADATPVAEHRHVKTRILRPRVVCGNDYNYWGPERLCLNH